MISNFIKGRVYVFIDVANIFYTQRTLGWRISYEKLKRYFKDECKKDLGKMFVYTGILHIAKLNLKLAKN